MDKNENVNLFHQLMETKFGKWDDSVFDSVLSPNYKENEPSATQGIRELKAMRANLLNAFSDQQLIIQDQITEDDKVVFRWNWQAVHSGQFMSWPATNKKVSTSGITIAKITNRKIIETWEEWNFAGFRKQLEKV